MLLKNKRILITAGPTWVPIDKVRVISNTATAKTGILLAQNLKKLQAKVTLLLGPVGECYLDKRIKVIHFKFFDELKRLLFQELRYKKYDILFHSAAVADYRPAVGYKKKIRSGRKKITLNLVPTPKIIDSLKKIDPDLFIVGFKFEPGMRKKELLLEARKLLHRAKLELVVANTLSGKNYQAYIVNGHIFGPIFKRAALVRKLVRLIGECI